MNHNRLLNLLILLGLVSFGAGAICLVQAVGGVS